MTNTLSIGFLGMGATGTVSFIRAVEMIADNFETIKKQPRQVKLVLIDGDGDFAQGSPYSDKSPIFLLNQRADRMSLSPDRDGDFCEWLQDKKDAVLDELEISCAKYDELFDSGMTPEAIAMQEPHCAIAKAITTHTPKSYLPRTVYGMYMHDRYQRALALVKGMNEEWCNECGSKAPMIEVETVQTNVIDIKKRADGGFTLGRGGYVVEPRYEEEGDRSELGSHFGRSIDNNIRIDHLVVATGHQMNNSLSALRDNKGYADTPFTVDELRTALANNEGDEPVLIVGTGQAMLDAIAVLEGLGFKGKYQLMSRGLVEPWPQDYRDPPEGDYEYSCCGPDHVASIVAEHGEKNPLAAISLAFQEEMHCESALTAGGQHVINCTVRREGEFRAAFGEIGAKHADAFLKLIDKHDHNSTSPSRFDLYKRLKDAGRLELISGEVIGSMEADATALKDGKVRDSKVIIYKDGRGKREYIEASVIINAASMERRAVDEHGHAYDQAIQSLIDEAVLNCDADRGGVSSAVPNCVVAGPADGKNQWGVAYMRDPATRAVASLLSHAFGLSVDQTTKPKHKL